MADSKSSKSLSLPLVLQALRVHNGISRIEISRLLNLDRSTITNIVARLESEGLVKTLSTGISAPNKGGRKPLLIGLNPEYGGVLGLEIQDDHYKAVLVDLNGQEYFRASGSIDNHQTDFENSIQTILTRLKPQIAQSELPLIGIGVGMPGHINPVNAEVIQSRVHQLRNYSFGSRISQLTGLPVCIDNDANCCAWSQIEQTKQHHQENFLVLILKSMQIEGSPEKLNELGIGVVISGKVYYGADFSAGEFTNTISRKISEIMVSETNGDPQSRPAEAILHHLDLVFSVFNPQEIVLGGDFLTIDHISDQIDNYRSNLDPDHPLHNKDIRLSDKGDYDVPFGAASMFLEQLFALPDFTGHNLVHSETASHSEASSIQKIAWENIFSLKQDLIKLNGGNHND